MNERSARGFLGSTGPGRRNRPTFSRVSSCRANAAAGSGSRWVTRRTATEGGSGVAAGEGGGAAAGCGAAAGTGADAGGDGAEAEAGGCAAPAGGWGALADAGEGALAAA